MVTQQQAEKEVQQILYSNMEQYVNTYIIPEIQSVSRAANLPDEFIEGIKFRKIGDNDGEIINTWGDDEKPLALWFNDGTKDHDIWSTGEWPLHWKSLLGNDVYVSTKNKPVHVRGLPQTRAMQIGIFLGKKRIIREVPRVVEVELK